MSLTSTSTPSSPVLDDRPFREIRGGLIVVGAFFVVFVGWASFVRLDAAASMSGQVAVAGHRQTLQHRDGGIIGAMHVREGQHVRAGDVLIELAAAEVGANEASLSAQVLSLQAQRARLEAERDGSRAIARPPEWVSLSPDEMKVADAALNAQQKQLYVRAASASTQKSVLRQRQAQINAQIQGYSQQVSANDQQHALIEEQLNSTMRLARQGFASANTVRALQRNAADLGGARGQYAASVAASRQQIGETQFQIIQVDRQKMEDVASQYRDVVFQLNDLLPKLQAAKDELAHTTIRAPVSGMVVGLSVFSVGAVIAPGQKLMDIVPDKAPLVIEAQVQPTDADDLSVGQTAEVKFEAFRQRDLPIVTGKVTEISADSFMDEKTSKRYYSAEITISPAELAKLKSHAGQEQGLKPGLPVQVLVPLRKRTALQYLLEPLNEAVWRAFREH